MTKMLLAADKLLARGPDISRHGWAERDTILYNLGIGMGAAAIEDPALLRYVLEDGLTAFPTMAAVLGVSAGMNSDPSLGIDYAGILHGEEAVEIAEPLPTQGTFVGRSHVEGVWDRGPEKGAVMRLRKMVHHADDDRLLATCHTTLVLRRNGGFGGSEAGAPRAQAVPDRDPDGSVDIGTRPEQSLIYRLSGDHNPLHAVPEVARQAGFPSPILHGLCSYALAARAIVQTFGGGDETRLKRFGLRFSSPVYPGETLRTEYWTLGDGEIAFQGRSVERDRIVLSGGRAWISG